MTYTGAVTASRQARNAALDVALQQRGRATHEAEVEYSETLGKLFERFDEDRAEALRRFLLAVTPAHKAYNAAVIVAEGHQVS